MPQITFYGISENLSIPVKIFINRRNVLKQASKSVTVNQKSIIKLKKINHIRLSPNDLRSLFDDIGDLLKFHLLSASIDSLIESIDSNSKNELDIELSNKDWKCNLVIHLSNIVSLRQGLGKLSDIDAEILEKRKIKVLNTNKNCLNLLTKDMSYTFSEDEKKSMNYSIHKSKVLHDFDHCFNLYINRVPSK